MNFEYAEELLGVSTVVSHFKPVLQGKAIAVRAVPPLDVLMLSESAHHAWMGPADETPPRDLAKC